MVEFSPFPLRLQSIDFTPAEVGSKGSGTQQFISRVLSYSRHRLLQRADALPDFPAFQVYVLPFPVLAANL